MICNACQREGDGSGEHVIHVQIGRVIVKSRTMDRDAVRATLQNDYYGAFRLYQPITDEDQSTRVWLNGRIHNLICRECNMTWAKQLEQDAGDLLYGLTWEGKRAGEALLRRWAVYFGTKMWWFHRKTELLASGLLFPLLGPLANPAAKIEIPVYLARYDFGGRNWRIAASRGPMRIWAGEPFFWMLGQIAWFVPTERHEPQDLPFRTVELRDGLRRNDLPILRKRELSRALMR